MYLITATRLPLNSRGSEDLRIRCCNNHPTLKGLPINIDGAHFQRAYSLLLYFPQVVDLRLLSVDAFSVMCQLQYHYLNDSAWIGAKGANPRHCRIQKTKELTINY